VSEFLKHFNTAHDAGWYCLMESPLEMTCPPCHVARNRRIQRHQVLRRRLATQPDWKRDIVVHSWAAMCHIPSDDYLCTTDMPQWLAALLGTETEQATHVRQTLEHLARTLDDYVDNPDAVEAARLANAALQ
jgi:hypothetical protein